MKALVEACQRLGVTFAGEDHVQGTVRIVDSRGSGPPCLKTFQRLHILEFDSTRKRMSVIVRNPSGSLVLVTKGAESSILPLCTAGPVLEVNRSIDEYAVQGLRSEIELRKADCEAKLKDHTQNQDAGSGRERADGD